MRLFLCEKASQAKDVAGALGSPQRGDGHYTTAGGIVAHASGHLLELAEPEHYGPQYKQWLLGTLPIAPDPFVLVPVPRTKKLLAGIKALLRRADEVVIATDADQEGELIAWEILEYCGYRGKVLRLWIRALDPASLRKALNDLRPAQATRGLAYAAQARSQGDWSLGMNGTRAVTAAFSKTRGKFYSVGRVQTPVLALIVRRDREIAAFQKRDYFDLLADVRAGGHLVQLAHAPTGEERIYERARADAIARAAA